MIARQHNFIAPTKLIREASAVSADLRTSATCKPSQPLIPSLLLVVLNGPSKTLCSSTLTGTSFTSPPSQYNIKTIIITFSSLPPTSITTKQYRNIPSPCSIPYSSFRKGLLRSYSPDKKRNTPFDELGCVPLYYRNNE